MNNLDFKVNLGKVLIVSAVIDGQETNLEFNIESLLNPLKPGSNDFFLSSSQYPLSARVNLSVVKEEIAFKEVEVVVWSIPDSDDYLNIKGKKFEFLKSQYLEAFHNLIYKIVNDTNHLSNIDRKSVLVARGNLKDFLKDNKESIFEVLELA